MPAHETTTGSASASSGHIGRRIKKQFAVLEETHGQLGQGLNDIRARLDQALEQTRSKA